MNNELKSEKNETLHNTTDTMEVKINSTFDNLLQSETIKIGKLTNSSSLIEFNSTIPEIIFEDSKAFLLFDSITDQLDFSRSNSTIFDEFYEFIPKKSFDNFQDTLNSGICSVLGISHAL